MALKRIYLIVSLFVVCFCTPNELVCKINAPSIECLKNITGFSYVVPSGLSVSSAQWQFGDGSTSVSIAPKYVYKNTGFFTVLLKVTLSNNTTVLDTHMIQVVGLPKAAYHFTSNTDTCSKHVVCLRDTSRPAKNGQPILKRLIVWGDGDFSQSTTPKYGEETCHSYKLVDKYLVKIEVTDTYGCKSSQSSYIHILDQTKPDFNATNQFKDCYTKSFCFTNTSSGPNSGTASYIWIVNNNVADTQKHFNNYYCMDFKASQLVSTRLIVKDKAGCVDSIEKVYYILIDSLPKKIFIQDTNTCYNTSNPNIAYINPNQNDNIIWLVDNQVLNPKGSTTQGIDGKRNGVLPGLHTITCQIIRGTCTTSLSAQFRITGPVAMMKILDDNNCFSKRQVFFVDDSKYIDRQQATYYWTVFDNEADSCKIFRAKNINNYTNCTHALDWYTKHIYKDFKTTHPVELTVKDTVTGCKDIAIQTIQPKVCSPLLGFKSLSFCQGDAFTKNPLPSDPKFISLDSGKTWKKFPIILDKPLSGTYDVGFIFETISIEWGQNTGNDSFRIRKDTMRFYDTIFKKDYLHIYAYKKDQVSFKFYGKCSPYRLSVHFGNGIFYPGESLEITWDDGTKYFETFNDTSKIDSIFHIYQEAGFNRSVRVLFSNINSCGTEVYFVKKTGNTLAIEPMDNYYCNADTPICFMPRIYDVFNKTYWKDNNGPNLVSWRFSDDNITTQAFKSCHKFSKSGFQRYQMIANDGTGCTDTLTDSLFIQDVRANVKSYSREVYCSELKQFFDSSSLLKYEGDSILRYIWDFGTGTFTNPQKNPFKSLNTSAEYIPVTHAVTTVLGCVDTIRFDLKIHGSHPYFKIKDTIGCDSLHALFTNLSKNCDGFIWEYGDPDQTSYATDNKAPTQFDYTKPGRYFIRLYGYDSVYNPATNAVYFCNNIFPDPVYQKDSIRSVLVIPSRKTGIRSLDTICKGAKLDFASLSDSGYGADQWIMGDDSFYTTKVHDSISHRYLQNGIYTVKLKPTYLIPAYNICSDSASKIITVLGVDAEFDIDPGSKAPFYLFRNKSKPSYALLNWDFGQKSSGGRNYSSEQNPSHHYGYDTGSYTICLAASIPYGCSDTTCKNIYNDYIAGFLIPNVFTPADVDGKNDFYDIIIEGESSYHLLIYDRWGVLVYEGFEDDDDTHKVNWNGKVMNVGNECPSGTYYYIFDYRLKTFPEKKESIHGVITLIR